MKLKFSLPEGHIQYKGVQYIAALDGLRGLAILMVLTYHSREYIHFRYKHFGWAGVDLFFVLSGFLITRILLASRNNKQYFQSFYLNRILRIFPVYYAFLTIFFIFIPLIFPWETITSYLNRWQFYFWGFIQNIYIAYHDWPGNLALNHFWSLAVEQHFYLFWPCVVYWFKSKNLLLISLAGIITCIIFRNNVERFSLLSQAANIHTLSRIDGLIIGAICAQILFNKSWLRLLNRLLFPLFCIMLFYIGYLLISFKIYFGNQFMIQIGYTLTDLAMGILLLFSLSDHQNNVIRKFLSVPFLCWLGKYSYGMYIYHWPILYFLTPRLVSAINVPTFGKYISYMVSLAIIALISWVSYTFYECWFLKFKTRQMNKTVQPVTPLVS